jgi:hypothetical protein
MLGATKKEPTGIVPLQNAVLCVDCETVSNSRSDVCPVCGGHSLLNMARMLGGTLLSDVTQPPGVTIFDMDIGIRLSRIEGTELTAALDGITTVIQSTLARGRATIHVKVEPSPEVGALYQSKAA